MLEVTQLVGQHGVHLRRAELLEQGVVKHHALGCAETGEVGIGMRRALAAVHHIKSLGGKAAALHQSRNPGFQAVVFKRFELVEDRCDHRRVQHQHQQVKTHPCCPCPQPPERAGAVHQPQNKRHDRQPDHHADQRRLEQIGQPKLQAHFVEAKALFNAEGAVQRER